MAGDPEQEYFSDGITEDIITDLSKISALSVIARHTSFTYKAKAGKVQNVGKDRAFELLERGILVGGPEWGRWIEHDSMLDPVRHDPPYPVLLETIRRRESERGS